jgi:integrase
VIKLQNWVVALLPRWEQQPKAEVKPSDLVFTAQRGGPIRETKFVGRQFKPLLGAAALPNVCLYDLRHTAATLALAAGISPKIVSEQLGHASVAFTLEVYSHVLPHMQDEAAIRVEALLMAA